MKIYGQAGAPIYKTDPEFWVCYQELPEEIQRRADEKFELLKRNPQHPSLRLKKVGERWTARINKDYRAVAIEEEGTLVWGWIGRHDEYMRRIRS